MKIIYAIWLSESFYVSVRLRQSWSMEGYTICLVPPHRFTRIRSEVMIQQGIPWSTNTRQRILRVTFVEFHEEPLIELEYVKRKPSNLCKGTLTRIVQKLAAWSHR